MVAADPGQPAIGVEGPGGQERGFRYDPCDQLFRRWGIWDELGQEQDVPQPVEGHGGPESVRRQVVHDLVDRVVPRVVVFEAEQSFEGRLFV
eukprot:2175449-Heterocapsa_arctica.AAC.1